MNERPRSPTDTAPLRHPGVVTNPSRHDEAAQVRAYAQRLGLPGLIDVHTHFMPQNVLDKVWGYFDAIETAAGPWTITYRTGEQERVATLRDFGVVRFSSLNYPHRPGMAAWLNAWSRDFAASTPEAIPSATFYAEPEAPTYVAEALDAGAQIFKVHIQVGGYDPLDPTLDDAWAQLEAKGTPVVIHCGSGPMPGEFTGPDRVESLLERHPALTLLIAHMGNSEYGRFLDLAERFERVHLDTTMAFTDFTESLTPYPREYLPRLVDIGDKVVLGSDFPNIPYPYIHQLDALARLDLGDDWMRGVLHDNAARLLEPRS